MTLLAQAQAVRAETWKNVVIVALSVIAGLSGLVAIYRGVRPPSVQPQPLEVREANRFVSVDKCKLLHAETNRRLTTIEEEQAAIRREMKL